MMQNEKKALRKVIQSCLKGLSQESKAAQSQSITNKIINLEAYKNAKSVAIYLPMTNEVSTYSLLDDIYKQGKLAFVPQIISPTEIDMVQVYSKNEIDQFPLDKWGIPIPINNEERNLWNHPERALDLIIVPGVGFDSTCNRLGHGKGFYDLFFEKLKAWCLQHHKLFPILIGVGFDQQIVPSVPVLSHDKKLDYIISNSMIYEKKQDI